MAGLGVDYSYARPGGAALKAAGVSAVGRYLATDGRGITAAEYRDLSAHGIGVWVCREGGATGMLGGSAQGVADAQLSLQQIAAVGLPSNIPVFATADFDVQSSQFPICDDYMRGFGSVLGGSRAGIYGGLHYMNHAYTAGVAHHFWQAGATSWDHGESPLMSINFQQTTNTPPLPGTDHNYIFSMPAGGGATPINNLGGIPLPALILHPNGTIGFVSDGGELDAISDINEVNALVASGIVGKDPVKLPNPQIWDLLNTRTSRLRAKNNPSPVVNVPAPVVNVDEAAIVKAIIAALPSSVNAAQIAADVVAGVRSLAFKAQ